MQTITETTVSINPVNIDGRTIVFNNTVLPHYSEVYQRFKNRLLCSENRLYQYGIEVG